MRKYARKFAYKIEDLEDVVQEACLLFYENPSSSLLTNKFYFELVKRGAWHVKFKRTTAADRVQVTVLRNQEELLENFDETAGSIPEEKNLDNLVLLNEFREKAGSLKLGPLQDNLMKRVLNGEDWLYEDRGQIIHLRDKLRKILL